MFKINEDMEIYVTRGDAVHIGVQAEDSEGKNYRFEVGDIIRITVFERKKCENVVLQKDVEVQEETDVVYISLSGEETKFGKVISKPKDYWYEIELNPGLTAQTIIGYDEEGAKIFKLFPEGQDINK